MKYLISIVLFLLVWGPPKFGMQRDPLAVRDNPFLLNPVQTIKVGIWFIAGLIVLIFLINHFVFRKKRFILTKELKYYLIFILIAIITSFNSLNLYYTLFSIYQIIVFLLLLYFLVISKTFKFEEIFKILYSVLVLNVVSIMTLFFVSPEMVSVRTSLFGIRITGAPFLPDYGFSGLVVFIFLFLKKRFLTSKYTPFDKLIFILSVAYVLLARTRSNYIVILLMLFAYFYLYKKEVPKYIFFGLTGLVLMLFFNLDEYVLSFFVRDTKSITTFSGRTDFFWTNALSLFYKYPLTGVGYLGLRGYYDILGIGDSHNSYIEILVGTGLFGFFLYFLTIVSTFRRYQLMSRKEKHDIYFSFLFFSFISILVKGGLSTILVIPNTPLFLFLLVLIYPIRKNYKIKNYQL